MGQDMDTTAVISVGKIKELIKGKHKHSFIVVDVVELQPSLSPLEEKIVKYILSGKTYKQAEMYLECSQHQVCYAMAKYRRSLGELTFIDTIQKKRKKQMEEKCRKIK